MLQEFEAFLRHDCQQHGSLLVVEPLLDELRDASIVPRIGILKVAANPGFDIAGLGIGITDRFHAGMELGKANAKGRIVCIGLLNDLIASKGLRRINYQSEKTVTGQCPTLGVATNKGLGISKGFGESNQCDLFIKWTDKLLGFGKDDSSVYGAEDTAGKN
jgi:hypothetical protein